MNLDNLINLGVDHLDLSINPKLEKYFTYKAFKNQGNPLIPMHMALHSITVQTAIEKKIKLILALLIPELRLNHLQLKENI